MQKIWQVHSSVLKMVRRVVCLSDRYFLVIRTTLSLRSMAENFRSNGDKKNKISYGLVGTISPTPSWLKIHRLYQLMCFLMFIFLEDIRSHGQMPSIT